MTDRPVSIINDVGAPIEIDVKATFDLETVQSSEGVDWGGLRELTIRVMEAD